VSRDLVIRVPAQDGEPTQWVWVQDGRRKRSGDGLPPDTDDAFDRLFLVLPSSDVFVARVPLAARSEREARQAAPFLIEDDLAAPIDDTETFIGAADGTGQRLVYALRRPLADDWRTLIERIPARKRHVLPDAFAAMDFAEDVVLFADDGDLLICRPKADRPALRIEADLMPEALPAALAAANPGSLAVSEAIDWAEIAGLPLPQPRRFAAFDLAVTVVSLPQELLERLPGFATTRSGGTPWAAWLKPFRRAGAALAASVLIVAVLLGAEGVYYQAQRAAIDDAGTALFAATFPGTPAVNPEVQLRRQVAALEGAGGSDFLALATAVAELTRSVDSVRIDTLRYDRALNVLNVSARYADFSDFEALNAAAAELGVVLEDGGVRQSGGTLTGEFAVRLP
jgi:general secretion pathway protein L